MSPCVALLRTLRPLRALSIALFAAALLASDSVDAGTQRVSFRTDDGITLSGTWYEPSNRPAPVVILVHMLNRSRRDWDQLASRLSAEGIGALAFDLRGHGESIGSPQEYAAMVQDVRAARRFIATRGDAIPSRVGIAGASLGASLALLAASDDSGVMSLALLSPSLDYRGVRIEPAMKKYASRPLLMVASDDDSYAMRSARELQKVTGGIRDLRILSHAGHGTTMLARDQDLIRALVDWFRKTLL